MRTCPWILEKPLMVVASSDEAYLRTAQADLGGHELLLHFAPEAGELRIFLDGAPIHEPGQATPGAAWFKLCRDLGYEPDAHWDLDPALILFRQAVPTLATTWAERELPLDEDGLPPGLISLATVQAAWTTGTATLCDHLKHTEEGRRASACFDALPLRAVAFHDDPGRREDFVGTGVDEPLLGIDLHLGASRSRRVTLAKATVVGTGGLRWSPWELGGHWAEDGREFHAGLRPEAFLWAAGQERTTAPAFTRAFQEALATLMATVDPAVEAYRSSYPTGVVWHRDPLARYLNHMIVDVRMEDGRALLILDDGTDVEVAGLKSRSVCVP